MDDARAADFLDSLPEEKRKLAEMIRRTVLHADKKIERAIKCRNLTFVNNGKNIAFVYRYDNAPYINLISKRYVTQRPKRTFSRNRERYATCKDLFRERYRQKAIYCLGQRSCAIRSRQVADICEYILGMYAIILVV